MLDYHVHRSPEQQKALLEVLRRRRGKLNRFVGQRDGCVDHGSIHRGHRRRHRRCGGLVGTTELERFAKDRVPRVVTQRPRQVTGERGEEEPQRPSDDHVVVEVDVECDQDDRVADTWRSRVFIRGSS